MSNTSKYFKQGGSNGSTLRAIFKLDQMQGVGFLFGSKPEIVDLEPGDVITNCFEISEQEFNNHIDSWTTLATSFYKPRFQARTEYRVIFKDYDLIGYSQRSPEDLLDFLEAHRGKTFLMLDEDGSKIAFIGPEISSQASFTTWEL